MCSICSARSSPVQPKRAADGHEQLHGPHRGGVFEPELPDNGADTIPESNGVPEVRFKDVSFAYGDKEVLHNVSFDLKRNSMVALVGPSGGESHDCKPSDPLLDVKSGQVLIRGKDVREVKLSDLMNHISMVFQRVYLFQDTIYNNISMGRRMRAKPR